MLPSPMQLFSTSSAVTTVHVEHPAPPDWEPLNPSNWEGQGQQIGIPEEVSTLISKLLFLTSSCCVFLQPSLRRPQTATFTKTTSAKRISTSSFKVCTRLPGVLQDCCRLDDSAPRCWQSHATLEKNLYWPLERMEAFLP